MSDLSSAEQNALRMYRFRSIKRLVDCRELEECSLFFAEPTELNDPGERIRDFVWNGDAIIWTNLFRHYLRCLLMFFLHFKILAHDKEFDQRDVRVSRLLHNDAYFDARGESLFESLCETMFVQSKLTVLIDMLANRPVKRDELLHYLLSLHRPALMEVDKIIPHPIFEHAHASVKPFDFSTIVGSIAGLSIDQLARLFFAAEIARFDHEIVRRMTNLRPSDRWERNRNVLLLDFPGYFLRQLGTLAYPDWYTACFSRSYSNPSLWGHYADSHRGLCIVFEPKRNPDGRLFLDLTQKIPRFDRDGKPIVPEERVRPFEFVDVEYENELPEIDFFRNLGRIPRPYLDADWYTDKAGKRSTCSAHLNSDNEDEWRDRHWDTYGRTISRKTKDWEYEEESRLVLDETFHVFRSKEYRKLSYDFRAIRGVIFGVDMSYQHQFRIHDLLLRMSQETGHQLSYAQAHYDTHSGKIVSIKV